MITLTPPELDVLAAMSGLDVFDRAVEFGNYHVSEWMAEFAIKNTEEKENDNSASERV